MSVNSYLPHLFILPEDDANRQVANGFVNSEYIATRRVQILPEAGGWLKVVHTFEKEHLDRMRVLTNRFIVLVLDFDGEANRIQEVQKKIPSDVAHRVFVLGAITEPERLRSAGLGSYEKIGLDLANDCKQDTDKIWSHFLLAHNKNELERLRSQVQSFLFE